MNHSSNVASITKQVNESSLLAKHNLPFILGETKSPFDAGKPGLSNTFGAVSTLVFCVICKSDLLLFGKYPSLSLCPPSRNLPFLPSNLVGANPQISNTNTNLPSPSTGPLGCRLQPLLRLRWHPPRA